MTDNSSTAAEVTLATALKVHGAANCPCCGRLIDRGDVSWNDADSGEGTPMTWAQIQANDATRRLRIGRHGGLAAATVISTNLRNTSCQIGNQHE